MSILDSLVSAALDLADAHDQRIIDGHPADQEFSLLDTLAHMGVYRDGHLDVRQLSPQVVDRLTDRFD